ncbi:MULTISPECIES: hypothetical protein [unclassified Streptomyces]|nr:MULTISPECIES: hypothetical protein [unclassified Streptomyces]MCY0923400.1 hypothetical protein [Streptomyces sp. H27-G5]MCY0960281.1 hypothetical protein [Streptomyces sp. H27-H5]
MGRQGGDAAERDGVVAAVQHVIRRSGARVLFTERLGFAAAG